MDIFLKLFYNKLIMKDIFFLVNAFVFSEKGLLRGNDVGFHSSFRKKTGRRGEKRVVA